jgi:hypothetical protein
MPAVVNLKESASVVPVSDDVASGIAVGSAGLLAATAARRSASPQNAMMLNAGRVVGTPSLLCVPTHKTGCALFSFHA